MNDLYIYKFKVKDYTTILVGHYSKDEDGFGFYFIRRGDGTISDKYEEYRIEWAQEIGRL